jgi:hypothetical protein
MDSARRQQRRLPLWFWIGLGLTLFFWYSSWTRLGAFSEYSFFPLWLGYILVMDGLVRARTGTSLLTRAPGEFLALFVLSAPVWWLFEGMNNFVLNWHYMDTGTFSFWRALLVGSIDFSTVIPAVFETTELVSTASFLERLRRGRSVVVTKTLAWSLMYLGAFSFAAVVLAPRVAFPLAWVWLVILVDPLNYLRGRVSLLGQIARGDWRAVVALAIAATVCGLFWEMWNYFAMPKWYYTVPFVGALKVFEMPLLGYGGYWPFAWELYAVYHLVWGVLRRTPRAVSLGTSQSTQIQQLDQ